MVNGGSGAAIVDVGMSGRPAYDFLPPADFFEPDVLGVPGGPGVFNVLDYGALNDASVNSQPMIQAAIQAAHDAGGGIVYLPPGTYGLMVNAKDTGSIQVLDNVFLKGAGQGETVLRLMDGSVDDIVGLVRSPWGQVTSNWGIADFTIDGNQANTTGSVDGFYTGPKPGALISDQDVYVSRIEIHDVSRYGFDPHERTARLTLQDSVAHDNGVDGFVLDMVTDSDITGNTSYANGRHGFNVVTSSTDLLLQSNTSHDNGGAGFVVQRGSENIDSPGNIVISGARSYGNAREGVLVQMSDNVVVTNSEIRDNGTAGVRLYGASHVTVENNIIANNSQARAEGYSEINLTAYTDAFGQTYDASYNLIQNNGIASIGNVLSRFGIEERAGSTAFNEIVGNVIEGTARGALSLNGTDGIGDGSIPAPPPVPEPTPAPLPPASMAGDDRLIGTAGDDALDGGAGNDVLFGKDGDDVLRGGSGNDALSGGKGNDLLRGNTGDDVLNGNSGDDRLSGGQGNDQLFGTSGNDTLIGGRGNDDLRGGSGADVLVDGQGNDRLSGGSGNDLLFGGRGDDVYHGGSGFDTLDFSRANAALNINASVKTITGDGNDSFVSIEKIVGSDFGDVFRGSDGANIFDGGAGDDVFRSAGGADVLTGGAGDDTYNWTARDVVFAGGNRGVDLITDFAAGDVLDLRDLLGNTAYTAVSDVVQLTDVAAGTLVSVQVAGALQDVVLLGGVHNEDNGILAVGDGILV